MSVTRQTINDHCQQWWDSVTDSSAKTVSLAQQRAWHRWLQQGLPTRHQESWKYTRAEQFFTEPLLSQPFQKLSVLPQKKGMQVIADIKQLSANINLDKVRQAINPLPNAVVVYCVNDQFYVDSDGASQLHYQSYESSQSSMFLPAQDLLDEDSDGFALLNLSLSLSSPRLTIPANSQLSLHIVYIAVETGWYQPSLRIHVSSGSQLTLVEHGISVPSYSKVDSLCNSLTQLHIASSADVSYVYLNQFSPLCQHVHQLLVDLEEGAKIQSWLAALGSRISRLQLIHRLAGKGSSAKANALLLGHAQQHHDHRIVFRHLAEESESYCLHKGLLAGKAKGVFNGRILMTPEAHQAEGNMYSRNMLLSRESRMHTKPELEIYHDAVRCAHGATIGQLDRQALQYLCSRGIALAHARQLLLAGFIQTLWQSLPKSLSEWLNHHVTPSFALVSEQMEDV
ncbi:SufD family Fe-S cluster assembly protein [Zooshikella harenae]|uniref:SufD family Fe-S cluster assembly protein n=1 Tax=Zooshikella harenae TaxID=2827238 RepID=A0ABS5ZC45_9GAMM|nr:SufD family Fe-S cluster assembly protein [Zooshikella harenae]MBU2711333.1 SufD family Fe-S cluster assembly protein [Zooshikella harenae]